MSEIVFFVLIPGYITLTLCMSQGKWSYTFVLKKFSMLYRGVVCFRRIFQVCMFVRDIF